MTSYVYPSAFSTNFSSAATPSTSVTGTAKSSSPGITTPQSTTQFGEVTVSEGLGSFICHAAYLESNLRRGERSVLFSARRSRIVNRQRIANGASFIVERADLGEQQAFNKTTGPNGTAQERTTTVAVKTVRGDRYHRTHWREVLLEIRALLHEPIRYHPNIVRLLDIQWGARTDSRSPFPAVIQEYAAFGTLDKLQQRSRPLPFSIKQKLCYDVGRALSIIHACGMVHGDLKHENVLIFPNRYSDPANQPYTAKLADFGGTVMDFGGSGTSQMPMYTFPFEAPEISDKLTEEGAKKTDAYSYGMLIWRCMIDSQDVLSAMGIARNSRGSATDDKIREHIRLLKLSDGLLEAAIHNIANYFFVHQLPRASLNLITSALMFTLRGDPKQRALDRAQVRLRGMDSVDAYRYVCIKDEANRKSEERRKSQQVPGRHGLDRDTGGFYYGRLGGEYDPQDNLPGFRLDLPRPERGGFLFEPLSLRNLLDRGQQEAMIGEFELYANSTSADGMADLKPPPWSAAFFLFESYLCGFGVPFDSEKACYWLRRAAEPSEETGTTDYLAMAWLNRIHAALGVPNPYDVDKQMDTLFMGVTRGHRNCVEDAEAVIQSSNNPEQRDTWRNSMEKGNLIFRVLTGSTGMPFFVPRKLRRGWDLRNLDTLDAQLKEELGRDYDSCLRPLPGTDGGSDPPPIWGYRFDKIYVNHKGHGLLHLAVVQGRLPALKHLHKKYLCNINVKNESHCDTPLICACRTGRLDLAIWCLENGADPDGGVTCEGSPLHCITDFTESEMDTIVAKLIAAGADMEKPSRASRKDVRGILADWEGSFSMTLSPLGRAVLKQGLPAVKILLKHGASPTGGPVGRSGGNLSPIDLAAVLTLPDILEELLRHVGNSVPVFDECEMLDAARSGEVTPYDSLSLHSRLVRCGVRYKENLERTLKILQERRKTQKLEDRAAHAPGKHLCNEILLGNTDIVSTLLSLGHSPAGSPEFRPLSTAVKANHSAIFQLLISHGPPSDLVPLLSDLAQHLPTAPRDLAIAECLLSQDCPPDVTTGDQPSPLVLAVQNGYFELADLLVAHGAGPSLNVLHRSTALPNSSTERACSLLGSLLRSQTSSSLRSITYLAQLHKHHSGRIKISPLAYRATNTTTTSNNNSEDDDHPSETGQQSLGEWNSQGQISASMVQQVLGMFPTAESLGGLAVHAATGTPVSAAVLTSHAELLRALLASPGYRGDWNRAVCVAPLGGAPMTPLAMARRLAVEKLLALETGGGEVGEAEVRGLRRAVEVAEMLGDMEMGGESVDDADAAILDVGDGEGEGWTRRWEEVDFEARIEALERRLQNDFAEPEIDRVGEGVNLPVDLSVLTEREPSDGTAVKMTNETTLQLLLKTLQDS
ncbi:Serine/threonine-protein kinase HT1 [Madurella mycetomatis]|uniref:Serine/threonine-protein kinase HT1 n=1 Tax=Madurella mycetomatis TaxID=100816 RepID=A0A175VX57_9PEZI|nr:Serine/threonine-protein kinase HT1 [Madurella mycetomatis]